MDIQISEVSGVTVAALAGDMDGSTAPLAQEQILAVAGQGIHILLDMTSLDYMSSAGARTMLIIYRTIKGNGGAVALVGLNSEIADMLAVTGFLDFFLLADTVEEGIAALEDAS